jgi:signal transduction histidine kinase
MKLSTQLGICIAALLAGLMAVWLGIERYLSPTLVSFAATGAPPTAAWRLQSPAGHALLAVLLWGLSSAVGLWAAQRLTARLRQLVLGVRTLTARQDLGFRFAVRGNDELAELAQLLNGLTQALQQSARLQLQAERLAARCEVARQLAHDIQAPLVALQVVHSRAAELPPAVQELLREATGRIAAMAADLVTTQGGQSLRPTQAPALQGVALVPLLQAIVAEKQAHGGSPAGPPITLQVAQSARTLGVACEASSLARVLSNIVDNAVQASLTGSRIEVRLTDHTTSVCIAIKDFGCGMPPEILAQVGRYGLTAGKAHGKGLGLHHAQQVMHSLGGTLTVISARGQGTTVTLRLPLLRPV